MAVQPDSAAAQPVLATDGSDYDSFAAIYSRWIGADFARRAWPAIERLISAHIPRNSRVLDLCCGCGHIARALSDASYAVTGLDASENMLRLARNNVPRAAFLRGDARDFSFAHAFDAVVSTFNSFAHVHTHELDDVFRCVRSALRDDGIFLFDLTMEHAYLTRWRGSFSSVDGDHACIVRPTYDPAAKLATNYVTAFEPDPRDPQTWRRSDFQIVQNCHSREAVEAALAHAHFSYVQMLDAQHDLGMDGESGRAFLLCK